tara:strand:+ start:3989 stop:4216 length:228 start_codon:yes stop_codon:yes gene_type:complete
MQLAAKFPFVFRLVEVEDAGHYDIETDYSDDLLDPMIDFLICLAGGDADAIERKVIFFFVLIFVVFSAFAYLYFC